MELLKYKYNGKTFIAFLKNQQIYFGIKRNNGSIDNNLTSIEEFIIKNIYNFIVGEKNYLIKLSNIKFNGKDFNVLYNTRNRLYTFYENKLSNNQYDIESLERLNYIFNNQNGYLLSGKGKDSKKHFNIFVKIGVTTVSVLVSGALVLSSLPIVPNSLAFFKADYAIDSLYKSPNYIDNSSYSIEQLIETIKANEKLTPEEQEFIIRIREEVEENRMYVDFEQLDRNLSEVRIEYYPFDDIYAYPMAGACGIIGNGRNVIVLCGYENYNTDSFKNCDKSTLVHEINHLLNKRHFIFSISGNIGDEVGKIYMYLGLDDATMEEMVNELFSREYLSYYTNQDLVDGYELLMPAMYALCEVIDEETLRRYKFDSDNYYITQNLTDLGVSMKDIHDLYKSLDLVMELANEKGPNIDEFCKEYYINNQNIYAIIKSCYEKKYNTPMENDLFMLLYFYETDYVDDEFNQNVRKVIGVEKIERVIPRGYVSKKYKSENPGVTIIIDSEKDEKITILNKDRFLNGKQKMNQIKLQDKKMCMLFMYY